MNQKPLLKSNATIYRQEVADVCLNCPYPRCRDANFGCELFKAKWKEVVRGGNRKGWRPKLKEAL